MTEKAAGRVWSARRFALLSVAAAVFTIALKFGAYLLTGSVGLFSDAAESLVNLFAAGAAFWALTVAARPADEEHAYGHGKVEYFAGGLESALILVAAAYIIYTATGRILDPEPLEQVGVGLALTAFASGINAVVALVLIRAGRRLRSITLDADGRHLLTDVWTSAGVIAGVAAAGLTGFYVLDPLIAILVALNIVWTGLKLLGRTANGLLDQSISAEDQRELQAVLDRYRKDGIRFHALRTRQSGQRRFLSMHVLVPGDWSVKRGHDLSEQIDEEVRERLPGSTVFIHIEPEEDPASFRDVGLDRSTRDG
ncbi:CDF: cation diffusion facilitator family transporter [Rubrobacter radiotolerans]|uniref:Cation diffusion facilitator family transporter n=1 Tax=Rubrobacter radiotolerans TaxID=42256 RepID=A0A023X5X0_RUBRA|nr:cation diffusion facilitator family transporter [Rubrobacter radiotolerans]AHY47571.1 CDF: cation diffusion facilitator family transporter [Rubrobacter radiotolerans]MDX5894976.1 cation diffusion facilitator family transporter [Rubrobacter radiotolerans]SMC07178.1 cation diffusion facilitator family transporter [Rubrobacter radiotolerans DSM 5868]